MEPTTIAVISAIAAVFSGVAAAISAGVAATAVYVQWRLARPNVRVDLSTKIPFGIPGVPEDAVLAIDVLNRGLVPVTIDGLGFELRDRRTSPVLDPREITGRPGVPRVLAPGEALTIPTDIRAIAQLHVAEGGLRCAYATSAAGDRYRSRPIRGSWLASWARPR